MAKRTMPEGICSQCGEYGPIFDVKNNLCPRCAGKKGGRPRKNPPPPPAPAAETPAEPMTLADKWHDLTEPDETPDETRINEPEEPEPEPYQISGPVLFPLFCLMIIAAAVMALFRRRSPEAA